jgi:hypothetical protein
MFSPNPAEKTLLSNPNEPTSAMKRVEILRWAAQIMDIASTATNP